CSRLLSVVTFLRDVMLVSSLSPPGRGWNVIPSTSVRANDSHLESTARTIAGQPAGGGQRWEGWQGGFGGGRRSCAQAGTAVRRARRGECTGAPAADARRQAVPRRAPLPGGTGRRPAVRGDGRQAQAHPGGGRRPGKPAQRGRAGRDVRRAVAIR